MDYEILGVEDDEEVPRQPDPPRRPVRMLVGVVLGLGALAALLLLFGAPSRWAGDTTRDSAREKVAQTAKPERAGLSVGQLCDPYLDKTKRLRVQFELVNTGLSTIEVRDVAAGLPLPGYLKLKTAHLGGVCTAPGSETAPWSLKPDESVLVTLQLTLLQPCPKPAPVQVKLKVRPAEGPTRVTLAVFADLGAAPFTDCA